MRLLLPLLLTATLVLPAPAEALGPPGATCHGKRATIVGADQPRGTIRGTAGRDVIVTAGARIVRAGPGDDLVCVTGPRKALVYVDAGDGDDQVRVVSRRVETVVRLGRGSDHFVGGPRADSVLAGPSNHDAAPDVVRTYGGSDVIESGAIGQPFNDRIDTGAGGDRLRSWADRAGAEARIAFGGGSDGFHWEAIAGDGALAIDNRVGTMTTAGEVVWRWSGLELFFIDTGDRLLDFTGSAADEFVSGRFRSADLGAGDDWIGHYAAVDDPAPGPDLDGGPGLDAVDVGFGRPDQDYLVTADLAAGTVGREGQAPLAIPGFEGITLRTLSDVRVVGDDGPNRIEVMGCRIVVEAGGGDDNVSADFLGEERPPCDISSHVDAGDGDDVVYSHRGDDVLLGGPGNDQLFTNQGDADVADGGTGRDVCRAEEVIACER